MPKRKWPQIGDKVIVPFGDYGAVGEVTRVEGWTKVYVTVEFKIDPDREEPTVITYNLEDLQPAEAA
ncbi:MAG: hypothetical protein E6F99_25010 [Actinobacteria bacterium]|nr:MAG: hypothetical protein E6F99_25010 [Actinomycetota bacterium]